MNFMKAIIVTGTPATGKTTIAKKIAEGSGCKYIDVNKIIKKEELSEKYDKKKECNVVDEQKLGRILEDMIKKSKKKLVIDSHLSHYIYPEYVEKCIVTKCGLKELKKRLEARKYPPEKIDENMECEIMDICLNEAREFGHKTTIIDSTKGIKSEKVNKKIVSLILQVINSQDVDF